MYGYLRNGRQLNCHQLGNCFPIANWSKSYANTVNAIRSKYMIDVAVRYAMTTAMVIVYHWCSKHCVAKIGAMHSTTDSNKIKFINHYAALRTHNLFGYIDGLTTELTTNTTFAIAVRPSEQITAHQTAPDQTKR